MRLDGKTIFVTGGSSGIGRAVVARAHALGARAYFTYLSGEARARDVELAYPGARALHCDLRSASEIAAAIELTRSETGRLDGLVHSAGIYREASLDSDGFAATLDEVMQINFTAAVHAIRAAVPAMRAQ